MLTWTGGHENLPPRMIVLLWTLIVDFNGYVFCYGKVIFVHNVLHVYDNVLLLLSSTLRFLSLS